MNFKQRLSMDSNNLWSNFWACVSFVICFITLLTFVNCLQYYNKVDKIYRYEYTIKLPDNKTIYINENKVFNE